jgi:TatD DNase family protein
MLVDSHCHLSHPDLADDVDAVVEQARAAGVGAMLNICTRLDEFVAVRGIAEQCADIYCSVGVHPHEASDHRYLTAAHLGELAAHPRVVAIGETGLDYYYDNSPRKEQVARFSTHCQAARETGLPLVVHSRDADDETASILAEAAATGSIGGVIHCFTGSPRLAQAALDLGFYISFSGILTFKKADDLRAIATTVPLDRLLVETDAPYLAPAPMRGQRNEPAFVTHTAAALAQLRGISSEALHECTTANFFRLFAKTSPPAGRAP